MLVSLLALSGFLILIQSWSYWVVVACTKFLAWEHIHNKVSVIVNSLLAIPASLLVLASIVAFIPMRERAILGMSAFIISLSLIGIFNLCMCVLGMCGYLVSLCKQARHTTKAS